MQPVKFNKLLTGFAIAGTCVLTHAQTLEAAATVVVTTPVNSELRDSESNGSADGIRQTAVASKSDSSFLEFNPIFKGSATGAASALADYGALKVFARSSGTGFAGGFANANARFADRFRIDGGALNGSRGLIKTRIEY